MNRTHAAIMVGVLAAGLLFASANSPNGLAKTAVKKSPVKPAAKPAAAESIASSALFRYPVIDEITALKQEVALLKKEVAALKSQQAAAGNSTAISPGSNATAPSASGMLTLSVTETGMYRVINTEAGPFLIGIDSLATTADNRYRATLKIGNMSLATCRDLNLTVVRYDYDTTGQSNNYRVPEIIEPGTWKSVEITTAKEFQTLQITLGATPLSLVTP